MKNAIDFYNRTATAWSDDWYREKQSNTAAEKFYECFGNGGTPCPRILDIGCGAGYDAKILNSLGAKVVGVDLSKSLIAIAKKHVKTCKFFVGDLTDKLTNLGKFDGILCLATIAHVNIDKVSAVFQNMASVLKKGGLLLISSTDGTGKDIEKSLTAIGKEIYDKNINRYTAAELCSMAGQKLKLVDTWILKDFDEGMRYYIFQKQ